MRISPNYTHEKLENPRFEDIIDVLEDRFANGLFQPCDILYRDPVNSIAGFTLLLQYYEAIWQYKSLSKSKANSKKYFTHGFTDVLNFSGVTSGNINQIAELIYIEARCGTFHDAIYRRKIIFKSPQKAIFYITYPKNKNGTLDTSQPIESIIIDHCQLLNNTKAHFKDFISKLKELKDNTMFTSFIDNHWDLNNPPIIGMKENDFYDFDYRP